MSIRILLVDDHQLFLEGLKSLIAAEKGMEVVGQAANGREAVRLCRIHEPDVVIMDITMPEQNGIEATREIREEFPNIKIIALSMHKKTHFVRRMIEAGANGYVLKGCAFEEITSAIRAVNTDGGYICSEVAGTLMELVGKPADENPLDQLTPRERQILQLIAEGKRSKEIAADLLVSLKTVEAYRTQLMRKLKIDSIAGLTKFAIAHGLTSEEF